MGRFVPHVITPGREGGRALPMEGVQEPKRKSGMVAATGAISGPRGKESMANKGTQPRKRWTRRRFLQTAGAATAAVAADSVLSAYSVSKPAAAAPLTTPPKPRAGARIRLLQWNSFVRAADAELRRQAKEW